MREYIAQVKTAVKALLPGIIVTLLVAATVLTVTNWGVIATGVGNGVDAVVDWAEYWGEIFQAAKIAYQMDRIYDAYPVEENEARLVYGVGHRLAGCFGVRTNSAAQCQLVSEIIPWFSYEGLVPDERLVYPRAVAYIPQKGGLRHLHLAGYAKPYDQTVVMNYRYANDYAPWHTRSSHYAVLIHELSHIQGVYCRMGDFDTMESYKACTSWMEGSNQIVTVEVLAAMSNYGTGWTIRPLAGELRSFAMDWLLWEAYSHDAKWLYDTWSRLFILTKPRERHSRDKSIRFWFETEKKKKYWEYIIESYGAKPWEFLNEALDNHGVARDLYLTERNAIFVVDDVQYFLDHWRQYLRHASAYEPMFPAEDTD